MPRPDPDRSNRPPKTHTRPKTDRKEKVTPRGTPERRSKQASPRTPDRRSNQRASKHTSASTTERSSNVLSLDALAKLDALNEKDTLREKERVADRRAKEKVVTGRVLKERGKHRRRSGGQGHGGKRRVVSGPLAEEGKVMHRRGGYGSKDGGKRRFGKKFWWIVLISVAILIVIIAVVAVMVGKKGKGEAGNGGASDSGADPANSNLAGISESDIPTAAKGSYFDPFTWYDTTDFNVTYTNDTVGGLPVMGLNFSWDDSTQANKNVPALDKEWTYGTMPIRGVNLGGWLSIEPFITPSFFNSYKENENIVDEWTLTSKLGPSQSAKMLEKHYALFVNAQTFKDIQNAGFDHIRIPFSYWAVTTYPGDPYVPKISWRYLLRAIEYARACGLRVNLDLHAVPGSQNGWNHSGRSGDIGWLNGTDGSLNGQRSLDIHNQLSTFFAQPRYAKVVAIYGLVNEPKMIALPTQTVIDWTTKAVGVVRKNGIKQNIAIGDGFLGLPKWQGKLEGVNGLILDSHPYTIFDPNLIVFPHQKKIQFACTSWSSQMKASLNTASGFGPTMTGEWSQADTDCALYLNNVGIGNRWTGTLNSADRSTAVLEPSCPKGSGSCSCAQANADPSTYSDGYKQWLMMNAMAQMSSFEKGWGWFYWTWVTESAAQWSWKAGMQAGTLPQKTWDRDFNCTTDVPDFKGLSETY